MKVKRKDEILRLLAENRMMKAGDLAEQFEVSMETIRRDLSELEELKLIRRVHGGAMLYTEYGIEPDYAFRTTENYNEKLQIGKKAAEMVKDGDSIIIDIGTTTLEFAKFLKGKKDLTVFTNSIKIAYELMSEKEISVILLGGKVRYGEGTTSGYWSEEMIDNFFADKLFLGVGAIMPEHGVMDYHIEETNLRRHFFKQAKQVIALADYSKFGIKALNHVCKSKELDYLITDEKADKKMLKDLREMGVKVIIT
ncbi:MAG: DeoR/GlpR transcriptional regulator [Tyzzerella sp.]|nr:DeoR/GlpR transcriptional regulator [Tyzzerella sp.]